MDFIETILPTEGLYCVAMLLPQGGFRHFFRASLTDAQRQIDLLNANGHTVFLAQATFKTEDSRKQSNALFLRNFFFDIDCGEGKDYPDQKTAVAALKQFIADTGLPFPAVVSSGNGLYAQWPIIENIPAEQWKTVARILKQTAVAYGFKTDPARTSDSASVLRPPGTSNRKPGKAIKAVVLLKDARPLAFMEFVRCVHTAAKKQKVDLKPLEAPKPANDINAEFYAGVEMDATPSSAAKVADKCAQLRLLRDCGGDVAEPLWYACLGVLAFCEDGEELAHEWSQGYADYSAAETSRKLQQWHDAGVGPSTCAKLGAENPQGCVGCPHNSKIKSPIVLGRPEPKAIETEPEQLDPPAGFRRTDKGLCYEDEGRWTPFYDCDLYVSQLAWDESLGYETTTICHKLPHDGWSDCTVRSSLVNDHKALLTALADCHIKVVGVKEKKAMCAYIESYAAKLQRNRRMAQLMCQMGWKTARNGEPMFVLGGKLLHSDGTVEETNFAKNVPQAALGFHSQGDLSSWVKMTEVFDQPGMEPFAFAMLAGGFGAPLMKFTGFDGALVSLVGESGTGKTLVERMLLSVWGKQSELMMLRDDTKNALVSRLGIYGNLPMAIDEITNIDGMDLSDFVYRITQGRDKARLTKNAEERKSLNGWNTLAVASTNASLVEKLSGAKSDATAEINRVFEYPVARHPKFEGEVTNAIFWTLSRNYGLAGEAYAKYLVQNVEKITPALEQVRKQIDAAARIRGDERFWSAIAAVAIYGGLVARKLGLIAFDVAPVMRWAVDTIKAMRGDKDDLAGDAVGILGQFLDDHATNRLIVKGEGLQTTIIDPPRGALYVRHEIDCHKVFISRAAFKHWLSRRFGSYSQIRKELEDIGALKAANARKTLGAGTYLGGAQQPCWVVDMKCHKLGALGLQVVQDASMLAKGVKEG